MQAKNAMESCKNDEVDISFYMPCLNEEDNVIPSVETLVDAVKEFDYTYEILIYDDNSKDKSVEIVQQYCDQHKEVPIRLIQNKQRMGVARNFVEGAIIGKGRYYCFTVSDNEISKEFYTELLKRLYHADVIVIYYGKYEDRPLIRRIISRAFVVVFNIISGFNLPYYNSAVHLRENVLRWHPITYGFGFLAETTVHTLTAGATYVTVEVPRKIKKHKVFTTSLTFRGFLSVTHNILNILAFRLRNSIYEVRKRG